MHLRALIFSVLALCSTTPVFAAGKTAVITLEFPHGAENCGMGEVGVSLADDIHSVFWNPASLPAIGKNCSVQYIYSTFYETLLPAFHLQGLWHTDTIHAFFMPNLYRGVDFGASYSVNFINMGENAWTDSLGVVTGKSKSSETVRSYAAGLRFFDIASLGFAIKDIESRLFPELDSVPQNGIAKAQVFDFGVRLEKKFAIAEALDIHPALGFALHSFPQDSVSYIHNDTTSTADPLPLKRWYGASLKINLLDMIGVTAAQEREYAVVDQEFTDHYGYKIQITPFFALFNGSLVDSSGERFEVHSGKVVTFNFQQTLRALIRCANLFDPSLGEKLQAPNRWAAKHHLNPNIFLRYAKSTIHSRGDNDARDGQTQREFAIGASLIGDLRSLSIQKWFHPDPLPAVPAPAGGIGPKKETPDQESRPDAMPMEKKQVDTSSVKKAPVDDGELVQ